MIFTHDSKYYQNLSKRLNDASKEIRQNIPRLKLQDDFIEAWRDKKNVIVSFGRNIGKTNFLEEVADRHPDFKLAMETSFLIDENYKPKSFNGLSPDFYDPQSMTDYYIMEGNSPEQKYEYLHHKQINIYRKLMEDKKNV